MSRRKTKPWRIEPHTQAKHEILRRYLHAWFPILGRSGGPLVYVDGFSGPGRYKDGEDGSPLIALCAALEMSKATNIPITFWFIDSEERFISSLREVLGEFYHKRPLPPNFKVHTVHSSFEVAAEQIHHEIVGAPRPPAVFALIDPFGFSGVKMSTVARFLGYPRSEVLVNVMLSRINRFLTHPEENIQDKIVDVFETSNVLAIPGIVGKGSMRIELLRGQYAESLERYAKYILPFAMHDRKGQLIYDLVFASQHDTGFLKMKEAMWAVDDSGRFIFSDATAGQYRLFNEDMTATVVAKILARYGGRSRVDAHEVESWIREETCYLPKHKTTALKFAESRGQIRVHPARVDGKPRRASSFPDGTLIDFLSE